MTVVSADVKTEAGRKESRFGWPSPSWANLRDVLPAFLRPGGLSRKGKQSSTAYLDALRGWAAFIVVFYHSGKADARHLWQLPLIHVLDAGHSMVDIFFVISGYVLSYRILTLVRRQDPVRVYESLAGSVFRRWFRLFLPTGFASLLVVMYIQFTPYFGPVQRFDSHIYALWFWFQDFLHSSNPLADVVGWWHPDVFRTLYLDQMWTIPVEYRGSLTLFLHCAICGRMNYRIRVGYTWVMILFCYYWQVVYVALFLCGMLIADYSLQNPSDPPPRLPTDARSRKQSSTLTKKMAIGLALLLSLFLVSQPDKVRPLEDPWPWPTLFRLIPSWWNMEEGAETFWSSFGAASLVFILDRNPALQTPLRWPFSQYLGELSFGMYATHLPVFWTIDRQWLKPWALAHFAPESMAVVDCFVFAFETAVVLWIADYFTRVDRHFVRFGHWLQARLFAPSAAALRA